MLSMTMEDMFTQYLNLKASETSINRFSKYINTYNFGYKHWSSSIGTNALYPNNYSFGALLARNFGGVDIIHKIATDYYGDETSILREVQSIKMDSKTLALYDLNGNKTIDMDDLNYGLIMATISNNPSNPYTFNKQIPLNSKNLGFLPIDIKNYKYTDSKKNKIAGAQIYPFDTKVTLGPYGFSLHEVDATKDIVIENPEENVSYVLFEVN